MQNQSPTQLHATLYQLAQEDLLDSNELEDALRLSGKTPDLSRWTWFLRTALISLSGLFTFSGILFFFAWNWSQMSRFAKFSSIGVAIAATALFAVWYGLDKLPAKISLSVSSGLIGVLFAVMGQAYQSPADSWTLFLLWSLFSAGWVLISRFSPLWLAWFFLANLTVGLWLSQTGWDAEPMFNILTALNAVILIGWELAVPTLSWMKGRWLPRTVFFMLASLSTITLIILIIDGSSSQSLTAQFIVVSLLFYIFIVVGGLGFYSYYYQDLFMPSFTLFTLIVVITTFFIQLLFDVLNLEIAVIGLLGLLVVGLGYGALKILQFLQTVEPRLGRTS
ncbi:MAG: DUF2157 domain-containing protein [Chloroflexota bacterium]